MDSKGTHQKELVVKKSKLPGAGKGLFTRQAIEKGKLIIEYTGVITTWEKIKNNKVFSAYVFYITRNHVIDARRTYSAHGRYANDAKGFVKLSGIHNNAHYIVRNKKAYIQATRNIAAGSEIYVNYGKEYWDVMKSNSKVDTKKKSRTKKRGR